jgi:uncharacterized protein YecT (DUF1311 family)
MINLDKNNMKHAGFAVFSIFVFLGSVVLAEDTELRDLEARLDSDLTQAEMNVTSSDIAQYHDKKLIEKEQEIMKDLDDKELQLFKKASKIWHDYRQTQVSFEGAMYRGGSIQPLIQNRAFARITRERYEAISEVLKP